MSTKVQKVGVNKVVKEDNDPNCLKLAKVIPIPLKQFKKHFQETSNWFLSYQILQNCKKKTIYSCLYKFLLKLISWILLDLDSESDNLLL